LVHRFYGGSGGAAARLAGFLCDRFLTPVDILRRGLFDISNTVAGGRAIARLIASSDDDNAADIAIAIGGFLDLLESRLTQVRDEVERLERRQLLK